MRISALITCAALALPAAAWADGRAERVGTVDTTFKLLGRNDRIVVDRYDDPRVDGVSCYVSRAETGGIKGSFGLATDPNRFSISCRAVGQVVPHANLPDKEVVFGEAASPFFKEIRVSRLVDRQKNVLVYLIWSTISLGTGGSAFNSISVVPIR
jgi:CreA protein